MSEDPDLIRLALQMAQKQGVEAPTAAANEEPAIQPPSTQASPPLPPASANPGLPPPDHVKELKTADELAAMILADLRTMKGCPQDGLTVTVYGGSPWNCWVHFGAAVGPLYNKAELQEYCEIITDRLKRLYDVATPRTASTPPLL